MTLTDALHTVKNFTLPPGLPAVDAGERRRYLVRAAPEFEIILMLWGPKAVTPIHDHSDSRCWMRLLEGKLTETTFRGEAPEEVETNVFQKETHLFIDDKIGFHRLTNPEDKMAASLHLYAKPLHSSRYFDEVDRLWKTCELIIDGDLRENF